MSGDRMPLPRLALQAVVVGHRPRASDDPARLTAALRAAFDGLEASAHHFLAANAAALYAEAPARLRVVSALADGADRLGALAAPQGWELAAVLPMPREEYEKDFDADSRISFAALLDRAGTVTELVTGEGADLANPTIRALQYRRLGGFLVNCADVLIAVWDGLPSGGPGGTGEVVGQACAHGVPVLWIHSATAQAAWLLGVQPNGSAGRAQETSPQATQAVLAPLFAFDAAEPPAEHGHTEKPPLLAFLRRPWPRRLRLPFAYKALCALGGVGRWSWPLEYGDFAENREKWERFCESAPPTQTGVEVRARLAPVSVWADAHAWAYAHIYRSAYVSAFALAGAAPGLGLIYLFWIFNEHVLTIKAGFVMVELAMILVIVSLVTFGTRHNWHGLWLETRELSELVRQGRALAYLGALRGLAPALQERDGRSAALCLTRAYFREIPPPHGRLDDAYLRRLLTAYRDTELDEQQNYHEANARNLIKLHHFLHHAGQRAFIATAVVLAIYLLFWLADLLLGGEDAGALHEVLEYFVKPLVSILAAGLPAIGAAIAGIGAQADFQGFAQRSRATAATLRELRTRLDERLALSRPVEAEETERLLRLATEAIAGEVGSWRRSYADKPLTLPG